MNAKETLELISKQWCSLNDLIKLTGLGKCININFNFH